MSEESSATDAELVASARRAPEGDTRAYEALLGRHRDAVLANCRYLTRSPDDAEDLAQEVFVKAYFGLSKFEGKSQFKTWVQRIKINQCLSFIEKRSGLEGRLLRPLSARLLPPTLPEQQGLVDRERLLDISGRSRARQMALAGELGVHDWPQPAGGCCFLTDESFGRKFFDLLDGRQAAGEPRRLRQEDVLLLSTGRHFRMSPKVKLIVGRTEVENALLERYAEGRARLAARDVTGPVALVEGQPTWEERMLASRIVARYGKGRSSPEVVVEWREGDEVEFHSVPPEADETRIEAMRV